MIELDEVSVRYGSHEAVTPTNLRIETGEFFTLLGPSGCGKTTILRAIAGFVPVASGRITIEGRDVTGIPAERRGVGMVFQNYALFPHMTVAENVAFGLKVARKSGKEISRAVDAVLEATGIERHARKKPAELSGGQQQRVAVARSLVMGTRVLLFDEPLSNLDAKVREDMRHEIKRLQRDVGFTAVFVTHDQEEALSMSDRLLVINEGRAEQSGTARELYQSPATPFVCQFVGAANEIGPKVARALGLDAARRHFVRPEHVALAQAGDPQGVEATVADVDYLGSMTRAFLDVLGEPLQCQVPSGPSVDRLKAGMSVKVNLSRERILSFDGSS
ncbi:MAG: ABC transporter ATP-binding protein [Boseongicola sp. SB0677_bin_26]|nr:ABC transporter ATP-binding protein [Boseongicola sp. SB0665_bin_10]MYG25843.1 ABC transporter ATP-binding protein [Boseongicola sp. SB0677_bin_26]